MSHTIKEQLISLNTNEYSNLLNTIGQTDTLIALAEK